jgi:hypothetical protein
VIGSEGGDREADHRDVDRANAEDPGAEADAGEALRAALGDAQNGMNGADEPGDENQRQRYEQNRDQDRGPLVCVEGGPVLGSAIEFGRPSGDQKPTPAAASIRPTKTGPVAALSCSRWRSLTARSPRSIG